MKFVTKKANALAAILSLAVVVAFAFSAASVSAANSVTVQLNPINGSNATGTGTITDNGDGTITVVINEKGLEPGDHIDHIHTGSCAAQGPIKFPLTNITANASGAGSSTTKINASFATVTGGGYYLNVHNLAKAGTSCGDITASSSNATTSGSSSGTSSTTSGSTGGQGGGNPSAPATGEGGSVSTGSSFPMGLALVAALALVITGSGLALARKRK